MYILKLRLCVTPFAYREQWLLLFLDHCVKLLENAIKLKNAG